MHVYERTGKVKGDPLDYTESELRELCKSIPAIAEKPYQPYYEIHIGGQHFATIKNRESDMVWCQEKQGWWVNKKQWLPSTTPFEIHQYPTE